MSTFIDDQGEGQKEEEGVVEEEDDDDEEEEIKRTKENLKKTVVNKFKAAATGKLK